MFPDAAVRGPATGRVRGATGSGLTERLPLLNTRLRLRLRLQLNGRSRRMSWRAQPCLSIDRARRQKQLGRWPSIFRPAFALDLRPRLRFLSCLVLSSLLRQLLSVSFRSLSIILHSTHVLDYHRRHSICLATSESTETSCLRFLFPFEVKLSRLYQQAPNRTWDANVRHNNKITRAHLHRNYTGFP